MDSARVTQRSLTSRAMLHVRLYRLLLLLLLVAAAAAAVAAMVGSSCGSGALGSGALSRRNDVTSSGAVCVYICV